MAARRFAHRRMPLRSYRCQFASSLAQRAPSSCSSNIASASMVMSIVLPTTTPPLSTTSFQLTPKSWRLILVLATNPAPHPRDPLSIHCPSFSSHHGVRPLAKVVNFELNLARHPSDHQRASQDVVARACDFYLIACECDPRVTLDIQKISTAEVRVTLRLSRQIVPASMVTSADDWPGFSGSKTSDPLTF